MSIRTTVTLDEDLVERLKQEARSRGTPRTGFLFQALHQVFIQGDSSPDAHDVSMVASRASVRKQRLGAGWVTGFGMMLVVRGRAFSTLPVVGSNFCTLAKWVE